MMFKCGQSCNLEEEEEEDKKGNQPFVEVRIYIVVS